MKLKYTGTPTLDLTSMGLGFVSHNQILDVPSTLVASLPNRYLWVFPDPETAVPPTPPIGNFSEVLVDGNPISASNVTGLATIATTGAVADLVPAGTDKTLYVSHSGVVTELALPSAVGQAMLSQGATSAPAFGYPGLPGELAVNLTGNQDNWAPTNGSSNYSWRVTPDSAHTITGLSLGQSDGRMLHLYNAGTVPITLSHDATSTAANRFFWSSTKDFLLFPNYFVLLRYSGAASRWVPIAGYPGPLPWIRFAMSTKQTVTSTSTPGKLSIDVISDSELWGTLPSTPFTDLTIPYSGYYRILAHDLDWGDAAITISTGIRKFGHELSAGATSRRMYNIMVGAGGSANNQSVQSGSDKLYLPAAETIAIVCAQTSGNTLTSAVAINDVTIEAAQLGTYTPN